MKRITKLLMLSISLSLLEPQILMARGIDTAQDTVSMAQVWGRVMTTKGKPIDIATVVLLRSDGSLLDGAVTDTNGRFLIKYKAEKGLSLRIQCLGYRPKTIAELRADMGEIVLTEDEKTLDEVVVRARHKAFILQGTTLKAEIASSPLAQLPTVIDILAQLPFVDATTSKVEVIGRGTPLIYLGHRQIDLEEVKRLNPADIKSIEVKMTPGAAYSAGVNAVIVITTRSALASSIGGHVRLDGTKLQLYGYGALAELTYFHRGLSLKAGIDHRYKRRGEWQDLNLTDLTNHPQKTSLHFDHKQIHIYPYLDAVYALGSKHEVGVSLKYMSIPDMFGAFKGKGETLTSAYSTDLFFKPSGKLSKFNANAYYHGALSDKLTLHAEGNYTEDHQGMDTHSTFDYTLPIPNHKEVRTGNSTLGRIWATKVYLEHPLRLGELQFGFEGVFSRVKQVSQTFSPALQALIPDASTLNEQTNLALYGTWKTLLSPQLSLVLGLRSEQMRIAFTDRNGVNAPVGGSGWYFFPSLSLGYRSGKLYGSLSNSSSISRPSYDKMRSSVTYVNEYSLETGNPSIKPEISYSVDAMVNYGDWTLQLSGGYYRDAAIFTFAPYVLDPKVMLLTHVNGDALHYRASLVWSRDLFSWWRPMLMAHLIGNPALGNFQTGTTPWKRIEWNNLFSLPAQWLITTKLRAQSDGYFNNIYIHGYWDVGFTISKQIGQRWSLSLTVEDLFTTRRDEVRTKTPSGSMYKLSYRSHADVSLSVSYKFNVKTAKYRGGDAGAAERSRL